MEGKDYVPFDDSTSGGAIARDQISAINNRIDSLEARNLQ